MHFSITYRLSRLRFQQTIMLLTVINQCYAPFKNKQRQSTLQKKMTAVRFTSTLQTLHSQRHIESYIFCEIPPCTNNILYATFDVLELFCAFLWAFMGFSYIKNNG